MSKIVTIGQATLYHGDCREILAGLAADSVDAIVTDPPYGLSFMGNHWDYDVPAVDVWKAAISILKPGAHLLAFAGTRTQHRMAVNIEDAGFDIRDMIAWVYGSGFPKSMDVSKAIDKAAGAEREVVGSKLGMPGYSLKVNDTDDHGRTAYGKYTNADTECAITAPATDAARQWQGWGTALKPALETVTFASKPFTDEQERDIILSNLIRLEARLWLLSSASAVEKSSTSSQSEYGAACAIAQWSADEITNTRADLCGQMDTSLFELATTTSLNIVSSWRRTLVESWNDGNTSTTETKSSTTTDLRILKFSLSQITPASIIKACSLPGGFRVNASIAESHFNASLSLLQSIRTLSATERAMSQAQHEHQAAGVKPNLDPCIMARKPLIGTVAENVQQHGTGALNIDGCRVGDEIIAQHGRSGDAFGFASAEPAGRSWVGRWPSNLIHDGSEEVLQAFPDAPGQQADESRTAPSSKTNSVYGRMNRVGEPSADSDNDGVVGFKMKPGARRLDSGSAARFFYCAKADKADRGEGNTHPTVKPTDLMRYLCALVTRQAGIVLDPFMGSGSTGLGAYAAGMKFIGIEREQKYFDIACKRIENATRQSMLFA